MRWGDGEDRDLEVIPVEELSPFARRGSDSAFASVDSERADGVGLGVARLVAGSAGPLVHAPRRPPIYRLALLAVMALFVSAVGSLLVVPGKTTPARAWAMVRDFVEDQETAHFAARSAVDYAHPGDDQEAAGRGTLKSEATGQLRLPADMQAVVESEGGLEEYVVTGGSIYNRYADAPDDLPEETWEAHPLPTDAAVNAVWSGSDSAEFTQGELVRLASGYGMLANFGMPYELGTIFEFGEVVDLVGTDRVRATADWEQMLPGAMQTLVSRLPHRPDGTVTIELDFGPRGRLDAMSLLTVVKFQGAEQTERHDLKFTQWGGAVDIAQPSTESVDETPHLDEEAIADTSMPTYAPTALPTGWVLDNVEVTARDDGQEECETATVEYVYRDPAADGLEAEPVRAGVSEPEPAAEVESGSETRSDGGEAGETRSEGGEAGETRSEGGEGAAPGSDDDEPGFDNTGDIEREPTMLSITSVAPDCPWMSDLTPSFDAARTVRVDVWDVKIVDGVEDNTYSFLVDGITATFEIGRTRILASTNAGEQFLVSVLPTLAPIDLAAQPTGSRTGDFGD